MGTKTRALGADSQLLGVIEETEGTAPDGSAGGVYTALPFKSFSMGAEKPLGSDDLLGFGRDAQDPYYEAVTDEGSIEVPIDLRAFGWWLRLIFGAPTTSGSGPYTHVFTSGQDLDTAALELGHTKLSTPKYQMHTMSKVNNLKFSMERTGALNATLDLIAQGQADDASDPSDADPLSYTLKRFNQSRGKITVGGEQLANVTAGDLTFSNNLESVETIRSDGLIDGIDEAAATATGSVTVRYGTDSTLPDAATNETPVAMQFSHTIADTDYSITWDFPRVFLPLVKQEVSGPGGIEASYDWQAAKDDDAGYLLAVTLINDVESYA